jgi:VanZ family protein
MPEETVPTPTPTEPARAVASGNVYTGICTVRSSDVQYRWTIIISSLVLTIPAIAGFPTRLEASRSLFDWIANFNTSFAALLLSLFCETYQFLRQSICSGVLNFNIVN